MMSCCLKPVMLQLLLLVLVLHTVAGRQIPASEHFSRLVQVSVVEEEVEGKVEVLAGPLHLHLERAAGSQLLRRVLAQEVYDIPTGTSSNLILMPFYLGFGGGGGTAWRVLVCRHAGG